jgi:hypothetical protein
MLAGYYIFHEPKKNKTAVLKKYIMQKNTGDVSKQFIDLGY